ncbi:hypothetical protein [Desulfosediminicola ganghwensis]|uniref:hypothetical protein n=1 Tax=Desulfosediminicola ganghwensis TaxID=2569540 RepID=UPI0010AD9320|nr:hypothetical protein [Desulfosediminicola ganghwensis]
MEVISIALDKLSNSMRLYTEECSKFHKLKLIDMEEAIDNLDRTFEAKLEAFHSLYDVSKDNFPYFENADTAFLIMLRNAIHHRDHLLFSSWNSEMLLNDGLEKNYGAAFLMASHIVNEDDFTSQYYYKLDDIYARIDPSLDSPYLEKKMSRSKKLKLLKQLKDELCFELVTEQAKKERYPNKQIYINIVPIFISAMAKIFTCFQNEGLEFKRFDTDVYGKHFTSGIKVDFTKIKYKQVRIQ